MNKIFSHLDRAYIEERNALGYGKYNGAYYYSKEIVNNIIPKVKTDRPWVTINVPGYCYDHAIVFMHRNVGIDERYGWMSAYKDLILVCSVKETCKAVEKFGKPIFLPLSIDIKYVEKFKKDVHDKEMAWAGNRWSFKNDDLEKYLPKSGVDFLSNVPREEMLERMSRYKKIYAVGRCAIEAKVLGCEVGVCDSRFPNPSIWKVMDNTKAAKKLQKELNKLKETRS